TPRGERGGAARGSRPGAAGVFVPGFGLGRAARLPGRARVGTGLGRRRGGRGLCQHTSLARSERLQPRGIRVGNRHGAAWTVGLRLASRRLDLLPRPGGIAGLGAAARLFGLARRLGTLFGLGFLTRLFGQAGFLGAPDGFGSQASLLGAPRRFGLFADGFFELAYQVGQSRVVAAQLLGLGPLRGDLPLQAGQQRGALFLLGHELGFLRFGLFGHGLDIGAAGVGLLLQLRQAINIVTQRLHGAGARARDVAQISQVASELVRVVAGKQRRPGRQAAGVLRAQLVGQFGAALLQGLLLGANLAFELAQLRFGAAIVVGQLTQAAIDARNGGFGSLERVGRLFAGGLARVDFFLQRFEPVAQRGLLLFGLRLALGQIRRRRDRRPWRCRHRRYPQQTRCKPHESVLFCLALGRNG